MTKAKELAEKIRTETEKIITGKTEQIKLITIAVLAGGHVLIDDVPGVGKTTLIKTMSKVLGCGFKRIQFVPDMLPADITGMQIYNQKTNDFELREGPVMTNILLADEINRAIPRTQSALLEAMEEHQVSIDGQILSLPEPFVVLATQNPIESESTFRLPAAQMDRFMFRFSMGYPNPSEEKKMLFDLGDKIPFETVNAVTNAAELSALSKEIANVNLSDEVVSYIVRLVNATREHGKLKAGASPRASRAMYRAAKVYAAINGRDYVTPDDVKALAHPLLEHRLILNGGLRISNVTTNTVLNEILEETLASPKITDQL